MNHQLIQLRIANYELLIPKSKPWIENSTQGLLCVLLSIYKLKL
ncbi:hypothetical protein NIES2107_36330 [Nostoc carneum NIES-2107]|nr:hypothetical protein NIES2107_36330 [Nostoc carneum NIES-2107]